MTILPFETSKVLSLGDQYSSLLALLLGSARMDD